MTTYNIIEAVTAKVTELSRIASEKGYPIDFPTLDFSLKGSVGGRGGVRNGKPIVIVNLEIAAKNFEDYLAVVIPHEFAHAIQRVHFRFSKPHGSEWKFCCRLLVGKELPRTHNYEFTPARVVRRDYVYSCGCRDFNMTALLHKRMSLGQHRRCAACGVRLTRKVTA